MLDCHAYRIFITGYIDGELSDDETQMLKTHLHTCKRCFAYLKQAEAMKIVLKRSKLLQDIPDVPSHFAQNISHILQQERQQERLSLLTRLAQTYRAFVFTLIEKWIASLRARPFAWITSMSCIVAVITGIVFVDVFHTVYQQAPLRYTQAVSDEHTLQIARRETPSTIQEEPLILDESGTISPLIDVAPDEGIEAGEFIEFADEPVAHLASHKGEFVENPMYSHVLEAAQGQFFDDAVFVGYVQDALAH